MSAGGLVLKQFSAGLQPLDLQLEPGQCLCLSGPSGSGKSRLLRAIADLDPHQGEAYIGDQSSSSMPPEQWRRQVGYLAADSAWWGETVGQHIDERGVGYLPQLGLDPDCLQWEISRLSSGEKQRLAMIRLLQQQPPVLLLDEPTANLDQATGQRVEQLLQNYRAANNATLLWVSHDPAQRQRVADRQLQIIGEGFEELPWS